jgi:diaminopimelate epimerase
MTAFFKVSGSGNDFLALAEPASIPPPERIRAWCRRGISLGADGLFILRRADGEVVMDYFNSDGLPADLCLNGTRCAAQLAFHLGWAKHEVQITTGAGRFNALQFDLSSGQRLIVLELPPPEIPQPVAPEVDGIAHAGMFLRVGVPHFVLVWPESLVTAPVYTLGRALRHHPLFPEGANVNFVRFPSPREMEIRTYERGVEGETLSCGSGILAGVAAGLALEKAQMGVGVITRSGYELGVSLDRGTGRWVLTGDARVVARGELFPEAEDTGDRWRFEP